MNIWLTGATGYLGRRIVDLLVQTLPDAQITVLKRSSSQTAALANRYPTTRFFDFDSSNYVSALKQNPPDAVIHCATDYGRDRASSPDQLMHTNCVLPLQLLDHCASSGVKLFINTGTKLARDVSPYSLSKWQFRDWLESYAQHLCVCDMMPELFYGPGDHSTKFVTNIVRSLLENKSHLPLTAGMQQRDFVYVDDVTSAFMYALKFGLNCGSGFFSFEVGSGQKTLVRDFVELTKKLCENTTTHLDFGAVPYRANEKMTVAVDLDPLKKLGWVPQTMLEVGLRQTIRAERKHL